jgi:hypothetical protein
MLILHGQCVVCLDVNLTRAFLVDDLMLSSSNAGTAESNFGQLKVPVLLMALPEVPS